ncbi:MAG: type VI secretion system protein TssL, partial [Sedimenticola sp.]|nr:type VI secretion system protein TssL [Sedimenticola sp.]
MSDDCPKCDEGLPPWLATFADLMSLLMCFFVLLLSFAEIDAVRFKKMADSMKDAFGVQREIPATDIVMGTSVIKQEFSPSTVPQPTVINEIRQQTTDVEKEQLGMPEEVG